MKTEFAIEWLEEEFLKLPLPKDHEGVTWHVGDLMTLPVGYQRVTHMVCEKDEETGEPSWTIFGAMDENGERRGYNPERCIHYEVADVLEEMRDIWYEADLLKHEELEEWIGRWYEALDELI